VAPAFGSTADNPLNQAKQDKKTGNFLIKPKNQGILAE